MKKLFILIVMVLTWNLKAATYSYEVVDISRIKDGEKILSIVVSVKCTKDSKSVLVGKTISGSDLKPILNDPSLLKDAIEILSAEGKKILDSQPTIQNEPATSVEKDSIAIDPVKVDQIATAKAAEAVDAAALDPVIK